MMLLRSCAGIPTTSDWTVSCGPRHADHAEPLIVDLDVAADRILGAEQRRGRRFTQHRHRGRRGRFRLVEEPSRGDRGVPIVAYAGDTPCDGRITRKRLHQLRRREPLARSRR